MISFRNAALPHCSLIPLKTVYKKEGNSSGRSRGRRILLTCIQLLLLRFCKRFCFKKNRSIIFFINWTIPRSIVNKYTLQVLRTLKTRRAFKQDLKYDQFVPQILCLQVSVLVIHWHWFQVSNARAHLAKRNKFASKRIPDYFTGGPDVVCVTE